MIGTSSGELVFIRLSIVVFRYTPLFYVVGLLGLVAVYGADARHLLATKVIGSLLVAEGCFYGLIYVPCRRRLDRAAVHPIPLSRKGRRALFNQCLANVSSPEEYLRWWFLDARPEDICRDNLKEFLLWAFFDCEEESFDRDHIGDETADELEEFIDVIEARLGYKVETGRGPAKCLRLTLDSIHPTYRSLPWYAIIFLIDQATHIAFVLHGFEYYAESPVSGWAVFPPRPQTFLARHKSPAVSLGYWHRPHRSRSKRPLIFFQGIGVGLWTYVRFLAEINPKKRNDRDDIGVIAIEILPISFRLTAPPLDKAAFLEQVTRILDHHGWDKSAVVSHSYGSVQITHMLSCPALQDRVSSVVLIDPVTIMLHLPDIAYNFTRRQPKRANEWQLWYYASTDMGVAHCLARHFFWRENIIWRDTLLGGDGPGHAPQRRVAVSLSERDLIVDVAAVAQYLADARDADPRAGVGGHAADVEVLLFPERDHAQVFDNDSDRRRIVGLVRSYCEG